MTTASVFELDMTQSINRELMEDARAGVHMTSVSVLVLMREGMPDSVVYQAMTESGWGTTKAHQAAEDLELFLLEGETFAVQVYEIDLQAPEGE